MNERKVLFVDDEVKVLNSLRRGLIGEEYKCFFAKSSEEALKVMEEHRISVIVTDMKMPGMNGLQLLKIVEEKYPDTVKIVLTGYAQLPQILATINQVDVFKFITKPWKLEDEFTHIIRQAIDYYNLKEERKLLKERLEKRNALYQNILKSTEDKLENIRDDLKNVKIINGKTLNFITEKIEDLEWLDPSDKQIFKTIINELMDLFNNYINILPNSQESFKLGKLLDNLHNYLASQKIEEKVKITCKVDLSTRVTGSYKLIYFILIQLMKNVINRYEETSIEVYLDKKIIENFNRIIIKMNIAINGNKETSSSDNKIFRNINQILKQITERKNCNMEFMDEGKNIMIEILTDFNCDIR